MAKIRILDERLINKIAAGEVVERPASALKELMENALDAGATEVRVELEAGGKRLIRVIDNGEGMDSDDLLLALERHATSKIREFDDLEAVGTLGFRGEAIPSIGSVSRMSIKSRHRDATEGREAIVEGGVVKSVKPIAMAVGTTVEVRGLFYNVPARRKFLKTTNTEYAHAQNVVLHYALAFPEVTFRLTHNGKNIIVAPPASSVRDRIATLLGNHTLERLIPFEGADDDYHVMGYVSDPSFTRTDTQMLHFFVNQRLVRDKLLIHALRSAYDDLLPKGRTPIVYLFLGMPAQEVDVNVHPSKTEVRFRDGGRVHTLVIQSVRAALSGKKPFSAVAPDNSSKRKVYTLQKSAPAFEEQDVSNNEETLERDSPGSRSGNVHLSGETAQPRQVAKSTDSSLFSRERATDTDGLLEKFATPDLNNRFDSPDQFSGSQIDTHSVVPVGQVSNSYIIALFNQGLLLIDQHAAHERILFEQLQRSTLGKPVQQGLLHPVIVDLPAAQVSIIEEHVEILATLGFEVEPFGPGSIALRGLPAGLENYRAEEIFISLAADIQRMGAVGKVGELTKELVISASCHGAIKVNTPLSREKMSWLIERLFECEMPMRCPHGRPVVLSIGEGELRRRFGRS